MWSATPEERAVWEGLALNVNKVYSNITVKLETPPSMLLDKLQIQVASNTQADIVAMQRSRMPGFCRPPTLQSSTIISKTPMSRTTISFNLSAMGFPSKANSMHSVMTLDRFWLYYNRTCLGRRIRFPSATTPMTWMNFRHHRGKLSNPGCATVWLCHPASFRLHSALAVVRWRRLHDDAETTAC